MTLQDLNGSGGWEGFVLLNQATQELSLTLGSIQVGRYVVQVQKIIALGHTFAIIIKASKKKKKGTGSVLGYQMPLLHEDLLI